MFPLSNRIFPLLATGAVCIYECASLLSISLEQSHRTDQVMGGLLFGLVGAVSLSIGVKWFWRRVREYVT